MWVPLGILGFLLFIALGGFVIQGLWNWLLPGLFGWPMLSFWQALGILALSRILLGGFGFRGGGWRHRGHHPMGHRHLDRMTPEEREELRQRLDAYDNEKKKPTRAKRSRPRTASR